VYSFGGLRTDEAVANEVLHAISGNAVEAALEQRSRCVASGRNNGKCLNWKVEQNSVSGPSGIAAI